MKILVHLLLIFIPAILGAQQNMLYESLNYKNAVMNGTRSMDGNPGPAYWINYSDYLISVKLDTTDNKIYGHAVITYHNESPDTLHSLVFRIYPDRYKKGTIRDKPVNPENLHDGVKIDTLFINESDFVVPDSDENVIHYGTNMLVNLKNPVLPGADIRLECKWNYIVPSEDEDRRVGFYKDQTWFIGYFYPQIAVYDDLDFFDNLKGWDYRLTHLGITEFYNDFNNYEVHIEVPQGYYVWATGTLMNPDKVYSDHIRKQLTIARSKDTIIQVLSKDDMGQEYLIGNTWIYKATGVPDFAFGTSPNMVWDASSVQINDRRVSVDAVYLPDAPNFASVIDEARKTIEYTSMNKPGIPFPYEHATVFNGTYSGGQEFPMIANDAAFEDTIMSIDVTYHEIFHNYTFMLGMNEKRYAFMDEGFAYLFTSNFLWDQFRIAKGHRYGVERFNSSSKNEDGPLLGAVVTEDSRNWVYYSYIKPYIAFNLFHEMVGNEQFMKAFRKFAHRWKGKHPTPWDFFYTFNDALGENYNWFWNSWFFTYGYADLGLHLTDHQSVVVQRVGEGSLPVPVKMLIKYKDGTVKKTNRSMDIWADDAKSIEISLENYSDITEISLDTKTVPDVDHSNNSIILN